MNKQTNCGLSPNGTSFSNKNERTTDAQHSINETHSNNAE